MTACPRPPGRAYCGEVVEGQDMFTWVVTASLIVGAPAPKDERKPAKPPDGEWWVEQMVVDGKVTGSKKDWPPAGARSVRFTSTKMILLVGGVPLLGGGQPVAYYQNGTVLEMDISQDDPKTVWKGIWKVDGDVLQFCYGKPGAARPTDLTAANGSGRTLWTLKRKPKE